MQASWYFDFISPFSYLQLERVRQWRARIDITPVPVAFGAILQQLGSVGPAEIPGKREFTYRSVLWQAERAGVTLRFPPAHPFNPLAALRLCIAAGCGWPAVEAIFQHLWRDGRAGTSAAELADVALALGVENVENATSSDDVKSRLRANTEAALAVGVFGVPTLRVGHELFWGNDASDMVEDWIAHPQRFDTEDYRRIANLPLGVQRRR